MIFSDEPRFNSTLVPAQGDVSGVTKSSTEAHVGPGAYLATQFEERRSGWSKPGFSKRQPMQDEGRHTISRSDHYISGVLSPNGTMSTPISPNRCRSPGPGYYEGPASVFSFPTDPKRKQDLNLTTMSGANTAVMSTRNTTMTSSPRFAFSNSLCLNKGVLFQSASNDQSTVGPGYYSVPRNDFLKKSHNVRARGKDNFTRSASNTPVTTPLNSPIKRQPATEVRQVTTPRQTYRPASASATNSPVSRPLSASGGAVNSSGYSTGFTGSGRVNANLSLSQQGSVNGAPLTPNRSRSTTPTSVRPSTSTSRSGVTTPSGNVSLSSRDQRVQRSGSSGGLVGAPSPIAKKGSFSLH